jgi:hypothetical protein
MTKLVRENIKTMQALGFSPEQIQNMRQFATLMRQAVAKPKSRDANRTQIFTDIPGEIMDKVARILGARVGNWINSVIGGSGASSAGVSLQSAQMGAGTASQISKGLRTDPAVSILRDAMDDQSLMKSLLLRDNATEAAKKEAAARLNAWAIGAGLAEEESEP